MNSISKTYIDFMKWFKETHPELHEKYGRNIQVPFQEGGGVSVSNSFKITDEEHQMLLKVAHSYYFPKEG